MVLLEATVLVTSVIGDLALVLVRILADSAPVAPWRSTRESGLAADRVSASAQERGGGCTVSRSLADYGGEMTVGRSSNLPAVCAGVNGFTFHSWYIHLPCVSHPFDLR